MLRVFATARDRPALVSTGWGNRASPDTPIPNGPHYKVLVERDQAWMIRPAALATTEFGSKALTKLSDA